jgi:hypothetical protein
MPFLNIGIHSYIILRIANKIQTNFGNIYKDHKDIKIELVKSQKLFNRKENK